MKILVTDRADFTPKEITKLGVDQVAHIKDGDPWPRWLAELGIKTFGQHDVADPEPATAPPPPIDPLAEMVAVGTITDREAEIIRALRG